MATLEETLAQVVRQERECDTRIKRVARIVHDIRDARDVRDTTATDDLARLGKELAQLYSLGRQHTAERIRLRLDIEPGVATTIIAWPGGDECPKDTPHAHLRFEVDEPVIEIPAPPQSQTFGPD